MNGPIASFRPVRDLKVHSGELVMCEGKLSRIVSCEAPERIQIRTEGTHEYRWVGVGDLCPYVRAVPKGRIREVTQSDPEQETSARTWTNALATAARTYGRRLPAHACQELAARMQVSTKTVRRRWRLYRANPLPAAQLPSLPGPIPSSRLLPPAVENLIAAAIDEVYLTREPSTVAAVKRRCDELSIKAKVTAPSYTAISARIKARDPMQLAIKRRGSDEAYAQQAPSISGLDVRRPLEIVQIDHALVDLIIVSDVTRRVIGRPWITVAIDVYTRCVVGYYMSFDPPDQTSVALTMEHSCLPKDKWLKELGLETKITYPMFGKMSRVAWDNAKTFRARAVQVQCERYGIEVIPRPVKRPHYGAYIERYIGTMMGAVHLLPGTTFSNPSKRRDYPSEKKATLTLSEFEQWLALQIAGVYHNSPHRGLGGRTPGQVWEQSWKTRDGECRFPPIIGDPRDFTLGFLPVVNRKVARSGIQLNSLRYWDPALTPFINDGIEHRIHYSQRDLTKIYLHTVEGYAEIPLLNRTVEKFSLWELRDVRQHYRDQGKRAASESELFKALEQQRHVLRSAAADSKVARRKVARLPAADSGVKTVIELDYSKPVSALSEERGGVE